MKETRKYLVKVFWNKEQEIIVEASSPEEAKEKALEIPEQEWSTQEEIVNDEIEEYDD